ncbi:MAG: ABC transporter substrate-binding protein [Victivallales bacterium]|nr:ABC transporter substrate-binding protein [Victivallales bacterium]
MRKSLLLIIIAATAGAMWPQATAATEIAVTVPVIVGETATTLTCREDDGNRVTIPKHPQRVVICYGSLVGVWYCAGGTALAIPEVTSRETLPEAARNLPSVGSFSHPDPERILLLRPDLVLLTGQMGQHRAVREILRQNGIASLLATYENYGDFTRLLELFCRINGTTAKECPTAAKVTTAVANITARARKLPSPRFLVLFTGRGVTVETSIANTAMMATMLGGTNIVSTATGSRVKFSMEKVMLADPDVILIVTMGRQMAIRKKLQAGLMADELWGKLRAVRTGRVCYLPNELFLYKANERFPEAFRQLAAAMYPQEKWE